MSALRTQFFKNRVLILNTKHIEATTAQEGHRTAAREVAPRLRGWDDERRQGRWGDGVAGVEMDGEGGVSDGRGVESGCGADAAGVERWGVLGASEGVRRVLLGSSLHPKWCLHAHAN